MNTDLKQTAHHGACSAMYSLKLVIINKYRLKLLDRLVSQVVSERYYARYNLINKEVAFLDFCVLNIYEYFTHTQVHNLN